MALTAGEHVLLQMRSGDQLLRHGVILAAAVRTSHLTLTPSRAIKDVDLSGASVVRILLWDGTTLPVGVIRAQCTLDTDSVAGVFTETDITAAIAASALGPRAAPAPPGVPAPPLPLPPATPAPGGVGDDVPPPGVPPGIPPIRWENPGTRLLVLSPVPSLNLEVGQAFTPKGTTGYMGTEYGISLEPGGIEVALRRVITSEAKEVLKDLRAAWEGADKTPREDDGADDVRTLPVRWDGPERIRDFAGAIGLMHQEEFAHTEIPHAEVGRYALWWLKTVKRNSLTAITHHTKWVHESSIHAKERAVYEHEVSSHAIDAFVSIDQLNCPNLLGFELLIRRVMLLEEAFSSEGGADFSMSDDWM